MLTPGHSYNLQGDSCFCVFAPNPKSLLLQLEPAGQTYAMQRDARGYWQTTLPALPVGQRYRYLVDGTPYPDPASRWQPEGVHAASAIAAVQKVRSPGWQGIAIDDAIIYELHLGTFTPEGTLSAAMGKLPHLQQLGITVIELMPIATFPGHRNWGYDGTYLFALQPDYGSYADLSAFIEAAHEHGMAVILDVVFNHFGPEGNYSGVYAPYTKQAATPWGAAINFDGGHSEGVRDFYLANTRYWLQEIGFDGFRMDAVSLIFDNSPRHILKEITDLARTIGQAEGREILMIAEHLCNETMVTSEQGYHYHSQWNDDLNHALFAYLTPERTRHYASFGDFGAITKALTEGFVLDGSRFDHHSNRNKGTNSRHTRPSEHVVHIQDHDQIGNRPQGDRMIASYGRDKALLAVTAVLASPYVPMLFMGEEYGEEAPFLFFEEFGDSRLVKAVKEGRKREFAFSGVTPRDAHAEAAFSDSKLQWARKESAAGAAIFAYYRELVRLKRLSKIGPRDRTQIAVQGDEATGIITLTTADSLTVLNFSAHAQPWQPGPGWRFHVGSKEQSAEALLPPLAARLYLSDKNIN